MNLQRGLGWRCAGVAVAGSVCWLPGPAAAEPSAPETDRAAASGDTQPAAAARPAADPEPAAVTRPDPDATLAAAPGIEEVDLLALLHLDLTTGTFLTTNSVRAPMSVTVIDRRQIEVSGARHLGELLEIYVPGFQLMVNRWNGDLWGMRGIATDRNTKIVYLVNGVKLNTVARDGNIAETTLGLMGDIERVEVLRGPAGLAYGSGAIAGVVNVVTREPTAERASVRLRYGQWQTASAEAEGRVDLGPRESLRLSLGHLRARGTEDGTTRLYGSHSYPSDSAPSPDGEPADGGAWRLPGNTRASLDYRRRGLRLYSRVTRRQLPVGAYFLIDPFPEYTGAVPDDAPGRWVDGAWVDASHPLARTESGGRNRRSFRVDNVLVSATQEVPIGQDELLLELSFAGNSNSIDTERREKYARDPEDELEGGELVRTSGERRYQAGVRYTLRRVPGLESSLGLQGRVDDIGPDLAGDNRYGLESSYPEVANVTYLDLALFSESRYAVTPWLDLHAGARADVHTRTGLVFTPRLGAVYAPTARHAAHLVYQSSANYASADNYEYSGRYLGTDGQPRTTPYLKRPFDPDSARIPYTSLAMLRGLEPERIDSLELGGRHLFTDSFAVGTSFSYNRVSHLLIWNEALFRTVNAGHYGFVVLEGELAYQDAWLSTGLSHVVQRPLLTDPSRTEVFTMPATEVVEQVDEDGETTYRLQVVEGPPDRVRVNPVSDSISVDGRHFLNLATHSTKLHVTLLPTRWLTLHGSSRVFWGLPGRHAAIAADTAQGDEYLGVDRLPIVKLNASAHLALPEQFTVSLFVNDLLGTAENRHAVRWQQLAEPTQRDLYTTDLRSYYLGLTKLWD